MAVQLDCPSALLSCLPRVDTVKDWREEQMPASGKDWDVKHFVVKGRSMRWDETTVQRANAPSAQGLFCFTLYQMPQYFLREPSKTVRLPGAVGKYVVLAQRKRCVLRYDRRARTSLCLQSCAHRCSRSAVWSFAQDFLRRSVLSTSGGC